MSTLDTIAARELRNRGRRPAACPVCARVFDEHTSYRGFQSNAPRRYCDRHCRREARNAQRRARRAYRHQYAGLLRMTALEADGRLVPLPGVPDLPAVPDPPAHDLAGLAVGG